MVRFSGRKVLEPSVIPLQIHLPLKHDIPCTWHAGPFPALIRGTRKTIGTNTISIHRDYRVIHLKRDEPQNPAQRHWRPADNMTTGLVFVQLEQ